jgi:hypothetical protein
VPTTQSRIGSAFRLVNPLTTGYEVSRLAAQAFREDSPALSEDAYKSSPYFRDDIPWDARMTEDRAAALAMGVDARKVRDFYAAKRPIWSFVGNMAGQALDPINYIPVGGAAVKAAQVARFGKIGGTAVAGALDAAGNTAIFSIATRDRRASYGDDVSWQATVSEIATAALIGGAFGAIGGAWGGRADAKSRQTIEDRLATLKTTQEARIALNEAIGGLARGEDLNLSPNATEPIRRIIADDLSLAPLDDPRFAPKLDVRSVRPDDVQGSIREFAGFAEKDRRPNIILSLGEVSPESVKAAEQAGVDVRGYTRLIEAERVRHVLQGHGGPATELPRGQLPITPDDIGRIPEIVDHPDTVARSVGRNGEDALLYRKQIGDELFYVETIRRGQHRLALSTMWKRPRKEGGSYPAGQGDIPDGGPAGTKTGFAPEANIGEVAGPGKLTPLAPAYVEPRAVDTSAPRPEPIPEDRQPAETRIAKPDDYKAMSAQYGVDPEAGTFVEEADIARMATEGRLTADDEADLADAQTAFEDGKAYGEALKSVVGCLL